MPTRCAHSWRPLNAKRERCEKCGEVYPCRHECSHYDCIVDTGRKLPVGMIARVDGKLYAGNQYDEDDFG